MIIHSNHNSGINRGLIVFAIMSATLMQVLDTTIVNVALPHMQGSLNASSSQISWVLTSYLIASAIVMPLTGYFADFLGKRKYLLWCIGGFTFASVLCGLASSISQIVTFRLMQGLFGAALVPLSQSILIDIYPPKELGKAMALWGTGVMVGPVLGPTLGGYLTEVANWRWAFYINIPVGILSFLLAVYAVPISAKKERNFDWLGFFLLALTIGSLQYMLDRGNQEDWFSGLSIKISASLFILGLLGFIAYNYFHRGQTVFDLNIFRDRNFVVSSILLLVSGVGLFGSMIIFPLFLESVLNYPVFTTGLLMTPRAISIMICMLVVGKICHRFDLRKLMFMGVVISAFGTYMCTYYTLEVNTWWLVWPAIVQGFGMGLVFVPVVTVAFSTLSEKLRTDATGVNSLLRTIGGSIGIAVTLTVFTRNIQIGWNKLSGFINPYNPNLEYFLGRLQLDVNNPLAVNLISGEISRQTMMLAIINVFTFVLLSFLVMLPIILLLKKSTSLPSAIKPVID